MARTKKADSEGKTKSKGERVPSKEAYKKFKKERNEELKKDESISGKDRIAQINEEWKTHEDNPNRIEDSE
ncbi:hypothetical protein BCR35DRAFT_298705 [Leucosporidium creatinivorum]|uniref:HMG box domain-containing protein n=1 Tax=Leucosporidium creatinivorum TaxID=106004 RepID=A0A1Y2G2C9_9BASI|nr:hypothetical protein BCR35DRAFT_298705 [Leucosporidium creatinivorum]